MSILKSMNIGLSGLNAQSSSMTTIGENISNMNTVGYKQTRSNFRSVLSNTQLGTGDGAQIGAKQQDFGQGSLTQTGKELDMAITGDGFFTVRGNLKGNEGQFYTRAGQFEIDEEGFITTGSGMRLQGYGVDENNDIDRSGGLQDLAVDPAATEAVKTSEITTELNLDSSAEMDPNNSGSPQFDGNNPSESSNFSSSITVHDSLGNEIQATVYYNKVAQSGTNTEWNYNVVVDKDATDSTTQNPTFDTNADGNDDIEKIGRGKLTFDDTGEMTNHQVFTRTGTPDWTGALAAADSNPNIMFDPAGSPEGDGGGDEQEINISYEGTTQFNAASTIRENDQDGRAAGSLRDINIKQDGTIVGSFSNDEDLKVGQVALAKFTSPQGLERQGQNMWSETLESGNALVGEPAAGGRGGITSGAVEGSNVDLAHEFTKLTASQRAYQANSRTVTTANQVLQETINLKR